MFFFQLPAKLPLVKRSASAKGKEKAESSTPSEGKKMSKISGSLEALSEGYMGKMLVYRSGAVKLKLGDILYDVSISHTSFAHTHMHVLVNSHTYTSLTTHEMKVEIFLCQKSYHF